MDQVFNELSLSGAHSNRYAALQAMHDVCMASLALEKIGFTRIVKTTADFAIREMASAYTYNDWINDKDVPKEFRVTRSLMLSRLSKSPYVDNLCHEYGMTELEEYKLEQNTPCLGLALAHIWGIPALSLAGDERFSRGEVVFLREMLAEDGTLSSEPCRTLLLLKEEDTRQHEQAIRACLRPNIDSGPSILEQATTAFPHLEFCGDAPGQLKAIDRANPYFRTIVNILWALDEAMRLVGDPKDNFMPQGIFYTARESDTTMQKPKTRAARTFLCPDGEKRVFGEHVRINIAMRVQFFSDKVQRKVYIGHVGEHLPTARF